MGRAALLVVMLGLGCAGTQQTVQLQAAKDFQCPIEQTRLVEESVGIFLLHGCGMEGSYQCPEFGSHCRRIFVKRIVDPDKPSDMENLAKSPAELH